VVCAAVFPPSPVALQSRLLAAALGRGWDDAAAHLATRPRAIGSAPRSSPPGSLTDLARSRNETRGACGGTVFRRDGANVDARLRGRACRCATRRVLRDLAVLLAAPGTGSGCHDLIAGVATARPLGLARAGR